MNRDDEDQKNEMAEHLDAAVAAADQFALNTAFDHDIRVAYKRAIHEGADTIFKAWQSGEVTAADACAQAVKMRNRAVGVARSDTSILGQILAKVHKEEGRSLESLLADKSDRLHGLPFRRLNGSQREAVHIAVIESAKHSNPRFDRWAARMSSASAGVLGLSALIAVHHVRNSPHKKEAILDEVAEALGAAGGASIIHLVAGPAASIRVAAGMALGAFLGAHAAHKAISHYFEHDDHRHGDSSRRW